MAYNVQRTSIYTLHAAMVHEHFDGCHMYICIYSGRTRSLYDTQSIIYIFFSHSSLRQNLFYCFLCLDCQRKAEHSHFRIVWYNTNDFLSGPQASRYSIPNPKRYCENFIRSYLMTEFFFLFAILYFIYLKWLCNVYMTIFIANPQYQPQTKQVYFGTVIRNMKIHSIYLTQLIESHERPHYHHLMTCNRISS